jgi:hypothetical protein
MFNLLKKKQNGTARFLCLAINKPVYLLVLIPGSWFLTLI